MENNKEKKYVNPSLDIIVFGHDDIILTSGDPAHEINDEELVP